MSLERDTILFRRAWRGLCAICGGELGQRLMFARNLESGEFDAICNRCSERIVSAAVMLLDAQAMAQQIVFQMDLP